MVLSLLTSGEVSRSVDSFTSGLKHRSQIQWIYFLNLVITFQINWLFDQENYQKEQHGMAIMIHTTNELLSIVSFKLSKQT